MTIDEVAPPSRSQERVVAEFRACAGKVGGYHASMQLLLLTTTGARTGQRRAVPLTYLPDGDRYIVTAGNAGSDRHPAWYYNLIVNPDVAVEVGTEAFRAVAVIAGEAERGALYELFAAAYPQLDGYQDQTSREIPLVIITRRQGATPVTSSLPLKTRRPDLRKEHAGAALAQWLSPVPSGASWRPRPLAGRSGRVIIREWPPGGSA